MIRKKICFVIAAVFISVLAAGAAEFIFLPDEINITRGSESSIAINLPLYAQIENAPAMTVNDKPVSGNININLINPVNIKVDHEASLKAKLNIFGITVKNIKLNVRQQRYVIPSGKAVGIQLNTKGVMVLGTGEVEAADGTYSEPAKNILKSGDLIMSVNGTAIENKEDLQREIKKSQGNIKFEIERSGNRITAQITPVRCEDTSKIGVWVRDSTQGIGTITFTDPQNGTFAALGHPITDIDTQKIMPIKKGIISKADIVNTQIGTKGEPGELTGNVNFESILGSITVNSETGIHGIVNESGKEYFDGTSIPIANKNDASIGEAYILSTIEGNAPKKYTINIDSINKYTTDNTKNLTITVTDKRLLEKTGGIVQGMSGSPIIQNGKLIGAVTHVFVQQPEKGYAIFAENMI